MKILFPAKCSRLESQAWPQGPALCPVMVFQTHGETAIESSGDIRAVSSAVKRAYSLKGWPSTTEGGLIMPSAEGHGRMTRATRVSLPLATPFALRRRKHGVKSPLLQPHGQRKSLYLFELHLECLESNAHHHHWSPRGSQVKLGSLSLPALSCHVSSSLLSSAKSNSNPGAEQNTRE